MADVFEDKQQAKVYSSRFCVGYTADELTDEMVTFCNANRYYVDKVDGKYVIKQPVTSVTAEEVRAHRDALLADTDHYLLYDQWPKYSNEQQQRILTYREALRTLTNQPGFPYKVTWPTLSL